MKKLLFLPLLLLTGLGYSATPVASGDGIAFSIVGSSLVFNVNNTLLRNTTNFAGDVTGTFNSTVVGNDTHSHTDSTISSDILNNVVLSTGIIQSQLNTVQQSTYSMTSISISPSQITSGALPNNIYISSINSGNYFNDISVSSAIFASNGIGDNLGNHIATSTINASNFDLVNVSTITGNSASGGNLSLFSTTHATKGKILFGTSAYDEVNNRLGIGTASPTSRIHGITNLSAATGNEIAYQLNYTTNKLTSGNDTGLLINMTDTASPGTSLLLDLQVGGVSKFKVSNLGVGTLLTNLTTPRVFIDNFEAYSGGTTVVGINGNARTSAGTNINISAVEFSASSGKQVGVSITPTINQTGTAAATDLLINRTQTAVGSGDQLLIDAQVGGVSKFKADNIGNTSTYTILFSTFQTNYTYGVSTPTVEGIQFYDRTNKVLRLSTGTVNAWDWR